MGKKKAVCLISGGLDSCVSAYTAKDENFDIYSLTIDYGQQHIKEIECAKKISSELKSKKHIILKVNLNVFGGSTLFNGKFIDEKKSIEEIGKKIPSTYVPARNTIFLSLALGYAESINANSIYIGVTSTDYSGYPDCRPEYIKLFQKLANIATKKSIENEKIIIRAPLIHLSKADIISKGYELNVPFNNTWSCYKGDNKACGICDSCLLRLKGFKNSNLKDPLDYNELPDWYLNK
jgi:7-cyano-7-deazaguanine synthase